jgi:hypothetical protein
LITLSIILSCKIYSQEIIEKDGRRFVDVNHCNEVTGDLIKCRALLKESRENQKTAVKVVEKVIVEDRVVKEYVKEADKEAEKRGRKQGFLAGSGLSAVIVIIILVILL